MRKLGIDFLTNKTILNNAGRIIVGKIIFFNILTKNSKRMCMYFIQNDTRRKIRGITNTET